MRVRVPKYISNRVQALEKLKKSKQVRTAFPDMLSIEQWELEAQPLQEKLIVDTRVEKIGSK